MKFGECLCHSVLNLLLFNLPSTEVNIKRYKCNVGSCTVLVVTRGLSLYRKFTVNANSELKSKHSDPGESKFTGDQRKLHSEELNNLFCQILLW